MAEEKDWDKEFLKFTKKLRAYFLAEGLTMKMLEKQYHEIKSHISNPEYTDLDQIFIDVIGSVIEQIEMSGIYDEDDYPDYDYGQLLNDRHVKNFIEFLCPIYGIENLRRAIEGNDMFNKIYQMFVGRVRPTRKYRQIKTIYDTKFKPYMMKTIEDWEIRQQVRVKNVIEGGRTPDGKPLLDYAHPEITERVRQMLGTRTNFSRKVRKSSRKKSVRKSVRKSSRKVRKSSRKKSVRKVRKSSRKKSSRKVRKSR